MTPAWLTVGLGTRVPGLNFSLMKLFAVTHTLPLSSLLRSWGPLCSGSTSNMFFSGVPAMAKDSLLCLSSSPSSAEGLWHPLAPSALLASKEAGTSASQDTWPRSCLCPQHSFCCHLRRCLHLSFRLWLKHPLLQETCLIALSDVALPIPPRAIF